MKKAKKDSAKKSFPEERKPGDTVKIGTGKDSKPITFKEGGLHKALGVPPDDKIPAAKLADAQAGKYGPKAKKQAILAKGLAKMRPGDK
jgi:hypothetical protein